MKDGGPQVTPVWFSWDGTHVLVNTAVGRVKEVVLDCGHLVAMERVPQCADEFLRQWQKIGPAL